MKKMLVYSHDAYGLGNIRRMLEITSYLIDRDPELTVLLVSGSPILHAFHIPARVDYVKLPCIGRNETGQTVVKALNITSGDTIGLRADIIMTATVAFDPDVILVDKKPFGLNDELKPAVTTLRRRRAPAKTILLLRDILDAPETTIQQWEKGRYHDAIRDFYDQVLVVGTAEVFDVTREYRFPGGTAEKVRHCGYIERHAPARTRETVRAELGFGEDPMVLVTAGGGADGHAMMRAYLEGLATRTAAAAFRTLLVSGPEMGPAKREELRRLAARCPGVTVKQFTDDMIGCMSAADVVVAMGGYNTVCELLTLKKRAVIVPRVRPVQEQWIRAERMQAMGLLTAIHPDRVTPERLIDAVERELAAGSERSAALQQFAMDGLPRIGDAVAELMNDVGLGRARPRKQPFTLPAMAMAPRSIRASAG